MLPLQVIEVICQLAHRLAKWSLQPSRQWFLLSAGNRVLSSQYLNTTAVDARCYPPINLLHVVSRIQHILIGHKAQDTLQCLAVEKRCPPDRCDWPVECHFHTSRLFNRIWHELMGTDMSQCSLLILQIQSDQI